MFIKNLSRAIQIPTSQLQKFFPKYGVIEFKQPTNPTEVQVYAPVVGNILSFSRATDKGFMQLRSDFKEDELNSFLKDILTYNQYMEFQKILSGNTHMNSASQNLEMHSYKPLAECNTHTDSPRSIIKLDVTTIGNAEDGEGTN